MEINISLQKQTPEVFFKKRFLKDFTKFLGKQLRGGLFYNKVADRRPATLL